MSLQEIRDEIDRLTRERGEDANADRAWMPEPIALLGIARRAVDAASAAIATATHPTTRGIYRQLGTVSRDLVVLRDQLDEQLATPAPIVHEPTKPACKSKPAKPSPLDQFHVGQLVDVFDSDGNGKSWSTGKVIKKTTRLHVDFAVTFPTATGHMAYEQAMIRRGDIVPHDRYAPLLRHAATRGGV